MRNQQTDEETNKKVSAMHYYSYRLMIRKNVKMSTIVSSIYRRYVGTYVKIETERLIYIRLNQTTLHSEEHIHLSDLIINDGNVNTNFLGRMSIFLALATFK